jgi:hypothetical protein
MSIFGSIVSAIFGHTATPASPSAQSGSPAPGQAAAPITPAQVNEKIQKLADVKGAPSNWKESIVDLMKLLDLDSSLSARKQLAQELGYTGALDGSAAMNMWLHKNVMDKLAKSGGAVPASLQH